MIVLDYSANTSFIATLTSLIPETYTGITSAFTLTLISQMDYTSQSFELSDLSDNIERYNEFELLFTGATGFYDYSFYTLSGDTLEEGLTYIKFNEII